MKANEWIELIESKREELKPAIEKSFRDSFEIADTGIEEVVIIDEDGDIRNEYLGQNTTPGDVWHGTAIIIAKFQKSEVSPEYKSYFEKFALLEDKKDEVVAKCNEELEDELELNEIDHYDFYRILADHFSGLVDEIEQDEIDCEMEAFEWEEYLNRKIEDLKQDSAYEND